MFKRSPNPPAYRLHKPSGLAVVTIGGKDCYLGKHDSPESRERYDRLIADWLARGRPAEPTPPPAPAPSGPLVNDLIAAYWEHCQTFYRTPAGTPSEHLKNIRHALRPLRRLYGRHPAASFGPLALSAVVAAMVKAGLARPTINARTKIIRKAFRWATSIEMIPPSVPAALDSVALLQAGRCDAPEPPPIEPVAAEVVAATLPHLPRPVAAMVRLQLLTGARVGEVLIMRGCDLTPGEPTWEYRPAGHKNAWRGHKRVIILGPQAVAIVRDFLKADLQAYLFDPRDSVAEARAEGRGGRNPATVAPRYDRRAYYQAVVRGCDRAFPHPTLGGLGPKKLTAEQRAELRQWRRSRRWSPLQLRHTSATAIRAAHDLEAAQVILGHARPETTTIYAEPDLTRAKDVMSRLG